MSSFYIKSSTQYQNIFFKTKTGSIKLLWILPCTFVNNTHILYYRRDVNITMLNPNPKRPLDVKIFQLECDKFRAQWLFHDLIKAKTAVGIFDNCLFTLTRNAGNTETSMVRTLTRVKQRHSTPITYGALKELLRYILRTLSLTF